MLYGLLTIEDSVSGKIHLYPLHQIVEVIEETLDLRIVHGGNPTGTAHAIQSLSDMRIIMAKLREMMTEGGSVAYQQDDAVWCIFRNNEKLEYI